MKNSLAFKIAFTLPIQMIQATILFKQKKILNFKIAINILQLYFIIMVKIKNQFFILHHHQTKLDHF